MSASPLITIAEAADLLGIPRSTAYESARNGKFPVHVISFGPRTLRVSRVGVEALLAQAAEPKSSNGLQTESQPVCRPRRRYRVGVRPKVA